VVDVEAGNDALGEHGSSIGFGVVGASWSKGNAAVVGTVPGTCVFALDKDRSRLMLAVNAVTGARLRHE
jgi:hypothetical protein